MTYRDDLDLMLSAWLDDPYTPPAPEYLGQVLERTRRTRQRPAWASLERWLPMADKVLARPASPPARIARLLLVALIVLALAAVVVVVGAQLLRPKAEIPQGGAAVIAFASLGGATSGEIFTVRADGSELRQVTSGPGDKSSPAFSPNGRSIAYRLWQNGDGTESIVVIGAGGGSPTILATNATTGPECTRGNLTWSPDGSSLIFRVSSVCDSRFDLFIGPADGSAPAKRLLAPGIDSAHATWSPDGTKIAVVGGDPGGVLGLYVVDVGQGGALSGGLTPRRIGTTGGDLANSGSPAWSPDGSELAFTSEAGDVAVIGADGSGSRALAVKGGNPRWSPDGRRIAFYRTVDPSEYFQDRPCTARIWVIDSDGTNERRLDDLGDQCDAPPSWSPDGTRLSGSLIASTDAEPGLAFHLGIITVDGSSPTVILQDGPAVSWQPVVAPLPPAPSFPAVSPAP
jgi:Tol biopolymer transport system component